MSDATRKKKKNEDMVVVAEEGVLNTTSSLLSSAEKVLFVFFVGGVGIRETFLRIFVGEVCAHKVDEKCVSLSS